MPDVVKTDPSNGFFKAVDAKIAADKEKARLEAKRAAEAARIAEEAQKAKETAEAASRATGVDPQHSVGNPIVSQGCVTGYRTGNPTLDELIRRESTYNSCATNGNGCFGLLQACPGAPLKAACGGNPTCQIAWFTKNKLGRYGSWEAVLAAHNQKGWW